MVTSIFLLCYNEYIFTHYNNLGDVMIIKETITIPYLQEERKLHIYVPDHKTQERFPVLYMFDGHNLYYNEDATYGKSWGLKEYLDALNAQIIVVGIECSHEGRNRLNEFSPYTFNSPNLGYIKGSGKQFFDWMIHDLKQHIDATYPTLSDAKHTNVGGSSMGGLMAVYGGAMHADIYSKAVCVSTAYSNGFDQLMDEITKQKDYTNSMFYLSFGEYEANDKDYFALMTNKNCTCANLLQEKGAKTYINCVLKGTHNEASWEKELDVFFKELNIL